jgi:hypothetical protein
MSFLSSLFTVDKKQRIIDLQISIENHNKNIEIIKMNMSRYKTSKAPSHYQDSGKRNIAHYKSLIIACKIEILELKRK